MKKQIFLIFGIFIISACWSDTQTQMVICAANNDINCIKLYLNRGEDVNGHGKEGVSPFYAALRNHNFTISNIFLEHHVNLNGTTSGRSYVQQAIFENDHEVLSYLKKSGVKLMISSPEYKLAVKTKNNKIISLFE